MRLTIHHRAAPPSQLVGDIDKVRIVLDSGECFELREQGGLFVRIEQMNDQLALDLAVFPHGGNSVRLKGGLR